MLFMRREVKLVLVSVALILILSVSFVSAGFFSDLWSRITGETTSFVCGNGIVDPGEHCDGDDWGPITGCSYFGFASGTLTCGSNCFFNTFQCLETPSEEPPEEPPEEPDEETVEVPNVQFVSPTTAEGNFMQTFIEVKVTATDSLIGLDTITITLFNSTSLVQQKISLISPLFVNFTNLPYGTYFLNATTNNTDGNENQTETRTIVLVTELPGIDTSEPPQTPDEPPPIENVPLLDDDTIEELANLRGDLKEERKELENYENAYNEIKIEGLNVINPLAYIKKWNANRLVGSQKEEVDVTESELLSSLEENNVPIELNLQLDEIDKKATTWEANYNDIFLKDDEYKEKLAGLNIPEGYQANNVSDCYKRKRDYATCSDYGLVEGLRNDCTPRCEGGEMCCSERIVGGTPLDFDWRNYHNLDYMTPVRNQAGCGSCWAFAVVGALEGKINAYFNNPNLDIDLSEQDLVSCSPAGDCDGGWPDDALDYVEDTGIADEACFPYTATDKNCLLSKISGDKCSNWRSGSWSITSHRSIGLGSIGAIKRLLIEKGPIITGMKIYSDFSSYSNGIYRHTTNDLTGNHAVVIVGYGKYSGMDYWIVKNSWGSNWGENGYFRILVGDSGIDTRYLHTIGLPIPPIRNVVRLCNDNDNDGYCNWGLGEKPSNCPVCHAKIMDCDDSDSTASWVTASGECVSETEENITEIDTAPPLIFVEDLSSSSEGLEKKVIVLCEDDVGCDTSSYKHKTYPSSIKSCPTIVSEYDEGADVPILLDSWVCGYGKDLAGNEAFSSPTYFKGQELTCDEFCMTRDYDCPNGCEDGKCIRQKIFPRFIKSIRDIFRGEDEPTEESLEGGPYYRKGTCIGPGGSSIEDTCLDADTLREAYCDEVEEPPTNATCTDSDDGKNYYVYGIASENYCTGSICNALAFDSCISSTILSEAFCDGNVATGIQYTCPNGCEDGACVSSPPERPPRDRVER